MKRKWIIIAAAALLVTAAAVAIIIITNKKQPANPQPSTWYTETYTNDRIVINDGWTDVKIPENGKITAGDLDPVAQHHYFNQAINALIELDIGKLSIFATADVVNACKEIKKDAKLSALWMRTVGNVSYLPESNMFFGKMPSSTYYMWYTDQVNKKAELPHAVTQLTLDELYTIWKGYYENTPNSLAECRYEYTIEDGYIKFNMDTALIQWGISSVTGLCTEAAYAELVFSSIACEPGWNEFNTLDTHYNLLFDEQLTTLDVDAMIQIATENHLFEDESLNSKLYQTIYTHEEYVEIVKDFMKKVQVYRGSCNYAYFVKLDNSEYYGKLHRWLEETDRYRLKDYEIYDVFTTGDYKDSQSQWYGVFYVLAHQALYDKI